MKYFIVNFLMTSDMTYLYLDIFSDFLRFVLTFFFLEVIAFTVLRT